MDIGFIGIGQMGKHMSRHIMEAGYSLTVHYLFLRRGIRRAATGGNRGVKRP